MWAMWRPRRRCGRWQHRCVVQGWLRLAGQRFAVDLGRRRAPCALRSTAMPELCARFQGTRAGWHRCAAPCLPCLPQLLGLASSVALLRSLEAIGQPELVVPAWAAAHGVHVALRYVALRALRFPYPNQVGCDESCDCLRAGCLHAASSTGAGVPSWQLSAVVVHSHCLCPLCPAETRLIAGVAACGRQRRALNRGGQCS